MSQTSKAKASKPQAPTVKNKVMSESERQGIAYAAMERSYKPVIQKALDARNDALRALLMEVYDESALKALGQAPSSLIHRRRPVSYEPFRKHYGGHELRIVVIRKTTDNEFLIADRFAGLAEMLPRDAMPTEITLMNDQKAAIRLAKEFVQRHKEVEAAEEAARDAKNETRRTLELLKRSGPAADALPEIADIIARIVGSPPKALVPADQIAKVRAMLKVAA